MKLDAQIHNYDSSHNIMSTYNIGGEPEVIHYVSIEHGQGILIMHYC